MRGRPAFVIFPGEGASRVVRRSRKDEVRSRELPDARSPDDVAGALGELGHRGKPLALAVPSAWCLAGSVRTDDLPSRQRREAMAYRLEEKLPVEVERLVGDFIPGKGSALGVFVEVERLEGIISGLEDRGLTVEVISPRAFLAAGELLSVGHEADLVLLPAEGGLVDCLGLDDGRLVSWRLVPASSEDLRLQVGLLRSRKERPLRVLAVDIPRDDLAETGGDLEWLERGEDARGVEELAAAAAARIARGRAKPWVELRRGALATSGRLRRVRGPLRAASILFLAFLVSVSAALHVRSEKYLEIARANRAALEERFREQFPGEPVPLSIERRLESKVRELEGLSGSPGNETAPARNRSAFRLLSELLMELPRDLRFSVFDLRVDVRSIDIEGEARTHGEADRIASTVREGGRFVVDAPRTRNLRERGVSFALSVTPVDPSSSEERRGDR